MAESSSWNQKSYHATNCKFLNMNFIIIWKLNEPQNRILVEQFLIVRYELYELWYFFVNSRL